MRRLFALILVFTMWFGFSLATAPAALADDFSSLTPCGKSEAFQQRLAAEVDGYSARLANFAPGSAPALYLAGKIESTQARFSKYANSTLLCGEDGLPHLISDGRWSHAGEFLIPSIMFLFITGWIGWVGRDYLRAIKKSDDACAKEIVLDVPLAVKSMLTGFVWPLAALKEFASGELLAPEKEVTVSPR
jgi:photosystem I subunit III